MLGNVYEWCQDSIGRIETREEGIYNDNINISEYINERTLVSFGAGRSTITGVRPLGEP